MIDIILDATIVGFALFLSLISWVAYKKAVWKAYSFYYLLSCCLELKKPWKISIWWE